MSSENNYSIPGHCRILLVDDVEMNQLLARKMIEGWGVQVDIAENGKVAVEKVQNHTFDLVLMDIQMPEMDGLEATRRIRNLSDTTKSSIPIVALTANIVNGDGAKYIAAGMNAYLPKPFDEPKLYQIISENLKTGDMPGKSLPVEAPAIPVFNEKLYDLAMVKTISGGDTNFVKRMVQIFIDTMPPSVEQLRKELQQQNWDALSKQAHKMKSTIDSMGIVRLKEVIRAIESGGRDKQDLESLPALVQQVADILSACIRQLKREFELG